DEFDVIVIGAGPPGENAAGRAVDRGLTAAIVEERLAGGECSYYGCIPSKTLIRPGDVLAAARRVPGAAEAVTGSIDVDAALAQAFKRLGSEEVTVIEGAPRLIAREEPFAGDELRAAFEAEGIKVIVGAKVTAVRREAPDTPVTAVLEDGRELEGDEILVAVGRRPRTDDIGLETVGLEELKGKFLDVDERLRVKAASGDWLYAAGDVNGLALLTHMGKYQGRLFGDVIEGKDVRDIA